MMRKSGISAVLAAVVWAGSAGAQTTFSAFHAADGIAQPHLMAARKLAAQENSARAPALMACYVDEERASQPTAKDPPPAKIMDNLYFLGTAASEVWAVDTSDGIVLIDSLANQVQVDQYIIGGLQKLGVDPSRIKAVIDLHAFADHAGGSRYLQDKYGAKVYMSAAEWDYLADQLKNPSPQGRAFADPRRDVAVNDGDVLTMGDTAISMFVTPAHSSGQLSLLIPLKYKGRPHTFVDVGPSSSGGETSALHEPFDRSLARIIAIAGKVQADGVMADHIVFDDMPQKAALMRAKPTDPNPFIVGPEATQRWLQIVKQCNLNNRDIDAALATRKAAVTPKH